MSTHTSIVIIEDNVDLATALSDALVQQGYTVSRAQNGEEGISLIEKQNPDLLLLDTLLPEMSGIDVLESLKAYRAERNLKVIILSNVDDPEALKRARQYDIEEYLIKTDWRMEDVIKTIKKHL